MGHMELGLDIAALTSRGRKPAALSAEVAGALRPEDVGLLAAQAPAVPELKRISERHHALARALASGLSEGEAAALTGYDASRVSVLKASPAFRELLDLYRDNADAQFMEMHARLAGLSKDAIAILHQRLEDEPEGLTASQLMELIKLGADRTGYGPSQKQETTVRFDLSERLDAARKRALAAQQMIDVTPDEDAG